MIDRRLTVLVGGWLLLVPALAPAADVVPGSISIGLEEIYNTFGTGISGLQSPIDMQTGADGTLYLADLGGKVIASENGSHSVFLDLTANSDVPFTSNPNMAGGLFGIAFHPEFTNSGASGYRKFYTMSSDWKTTTQTCNTCDITPGNELTGLPDFWHTEMYEPASGGNPLTNWANPNFPGSGNADFDHFNVIREWTATADGSTIDTEVEPRVILRMAHGFTNKGSHNGGGLRFGPDGFLYITTGDGGGNAGKDYDGSVNNPEDGHTNGTGNAQDRTVVYGKVLRIDPTAEVKNSTNGQYGIPADNPYVIDDSEPSFLDEIYAYGFRNPWKINFDDTPGGDGALYLSNVGQHHREEIDVIVGGGNYGWGYLEGNVALVHEDEYSGEPDPTDEDMDGDGFHGTVVRTPPGGFDNFESTAPLVDYLTRRQYAPNGAPTISANLVGEGTAVTGGFVYRGSAIPELVGMYVFGDYSTGGGSRPPPPGQPENTGRLFYVDPAAPTDIFEFDIEFGDELRATLLGFGRDNEGELYAYFGNGNVVKIVAPPVAGDYNGNGVVDALDYVVWLAALGGDTLLNEEASPGVVDHADYVFWKSRFGATSGSGSTSSAPIPEPATLLLFALAAGTATLCWRPTL